MTFIFDVYGSPFNVRFSDSLNSFLFCVYAERLFFSVDFQIVLLQSYPLILLSQKQVQDKFQIPFFVGMDKNQCFRVNSVSEICSACLVLGIAPVFLSSDNIMTVRKVLQKSEPKSYSLKLKSPVFLFCNSIMTEQMFA